MSVHSASELAEHSGHSLEIAEYGREEYVLNVTLECITCSMVLFEFDDD